MTVAAPGGTYLAPGTLLQGRYEVGPEIGRGAWSVVYAARDRRVEADVALKLLVPPPAVAEVARERMRREVRAARSLAHPHVVAVHDFGDDGAWSFIVMERVDGPDLQVRVRERGPLSPEEGARVAQGVASALAAAHRRGVLHRDVKPQNILLDPDGRARLADFGSARLDGAATLTQTATLVGTLAYTAPEVLAGGRGDARADLYALGITLYFALTGRLPESPSPHLPPRPAPEGFRPRPGRAGIPAWLDDVVARCTAADPGARFPTADALLRALEGRRAAGGALAAPGAVEACPLCGAPSAGLGTCLSCGDAPAARADTLVLARLPEGGGALPPVLAAAAARGVRGEVALARLPAGAAASVAARLAVDGVWARTLPAAQAWKAIPHSFALLVAAGLGVGTLAGAVALPVLLWTSPAMAALLLLAAREQASKPLVAPGKRRSTLPPAAERALSSALAALPDGGARRLLADVARVATRLHASLPPGVGPTGVRARVAEVLVAASAAALDLDRLDHTLDELQGPLFRPAPGAAWLDAVARCERLRDARAQRLLDALAVLAHLAAESVDGAPPPLEALAGLTRELGEDAAAMAEARREVEALLGAR